MALTDIASLAEVKEGLELESALSVAQSALVDNIRLRVEAAARQYVRHSITEGTFTHFLRDRYLQSQTLQLRMPYVTSVTSIHEDCTAKGGQAATDFATETLLTVGEQYILDTYDLSLARNGQVQRIGQNWSSTPRTIKVIYTAGLSATMLANEFLFVKSAIIQEVTLRYLVAKEKAGSDAKSRTIAFRKDW